MAKSHVEKNNQDLAYLDVPAEPCQNDQQTRSMAIVKTCFHNVVQVCAKYCAMCLTAKTLLLYCATICMHQMF